MAAAAPRMVFGAAQGGPGLGYGASSGGHAHGYGQSIVPHPGYSFPGGGFGFPLPLPPRDDLPPSGAQSSQADA